MCNTHCVCTRGSTHLAEQFSSSFQKLDHHQHHHHRHHALEYTHLAERTRAWFSSRVLCCSDFFTSSASSSLSLLWGRFISFHKLWLSPSWYVELYQHTKYRLIIIGILCLISYFLQSWNRNTFTFQIWFAFGNVLTSVIPDPLIKQHKQFREDTMEIQSEKNSYSCIQCNLSFMTTENLKTHMIQHDGKEQHSCNQCSYSSINATNLKSHMLVHSGEKPFACSQCIYSSKQAGNLKTHMRTHSGEKPFSWQSN